MDGGRVHFTARARSLGGGNEPAAAIVVSRGTSSNTALIAILTIRWGMLAGNVADSWECCSKTAFGKASQVSSYCVSLFYHVLKGCSAKTRTGWAGQGPSAFSCDRRTQVREAWCMQEKDAVHHASPRHAAIMRLTDGVSFLCCRDTPRRCLPCSLPQHRSSPDPARCSEHGLLPSTTLVRPTIATAPVMLPSQMYAEFAASRNLHKRRSQLACRIFQRGKQAHLYSLMYIAS